jgi:hypothetical protein
VMGEDGLRAASQNRGQQASLEAGQRGEE